MTFEEALAHYEAASKLWNELRAEATRLGDPDTWGAANLMEGVVHKWNGITGYLYRRDDPDGAYAVIYYQSIVIEDFKQKVRNRSW